MKKKICILLTGMMIACSLMACGKDKNGNTKVDDANIVQEDLVEFINDELPGISADKDSALSVYNSYFTGADIDNAALVADLKNNAIPSMETYISNLNAIEVETTEVQEIKQLYLMGIQKQYEAMKMVVNAIESEMPDYLVQAEALIVEAQLYMKDYEAKVVEIASNNQITINSETISSGAVEEATTEEAQ
ncbi:MAG: hypothetical protein E7257_01575 [Lachnospiraceae bacterium]|nr:hypothetical protein [Lachnospiraceae bacterium]MBQ9936190.1 hypothetical protein [Lachnospiraceae bacterium]